MRNALLDEYVNFRSHKIRWVLLNIIATIPGIILNLIVAKSGLISVNAALYCVGSYLTAGMISPVSGMICSIVSVTINPMFKATLTTHIFTLISEIGILVMCRCIDKGWLRSIPKTLLIVLINTVFISFGIFSRFLIMGLSDDMSLLLPKGETVLETFNYVAPIQLVIMVILYLYFKKLPDMMLVKIPNGIYYVRDDDFHKKITTYRIKCRTHSIEKHMYYGVIIMLALMTFAAVFSFNSLYFSNYSKTESDAIITELYNTLKEQDKIFDTVSIDSAFDKRSPLLNWDDPNAAYKNVGFFIEFISMLLSIEILAISVSMTYLRNSLITPIISVASGAYKCTPDQNNINEAIDDSSLRILDIQTGDEIEALYNSILKMIAGFNHYVMRIYHEQQLMNELEVEKKAGKAKSEFLSNMSHELRTPINAVIGLDEMILRESNDEEILTLARDIKAAGKSLLGLINDILDFSKIEAGKMDIIPVNYDLSSVVNDLINMIKIRADKKNLELIIAVDSETPNMLYGDEIRLKQVITNILTNAVKYTEKGSVTLNISHEKLSPREINLLVSVKDTGIGMKEEDLGKLFTAFERIEEKRNRTVEGTGLGLNITQSLLNLMGSRLEVKSVYGEGSTFCFALKQTVLSDEPIGDINQAIRKNISQSELYHESFIAPEAEILVVDDTEMNLTVVKGLLKQTQVQIDTALSGFECLDMVKKKKYDIIFLDHRMPEMDGIETLQKFNELEDNRSAGTPVIALTANALSGARETYIDAGFADYLTKPIDYKKLEKMIMDYLPCGKVKPSDGTAVSSEDSSLPEWIFSLSDINAKEGLQNCGSEKTFLDALYNFYDAIDENSEKIESYYNEKDWHNYNIKVHALKSSARLIGADALSSRAFSLEVASEDDSPNEGFIKIHHNPTLRLYRSYKEKLAALKAKDDAGKDESMKEPISGEDLSEAFEGILELIESIDYETADELIRSLDDYVIPDESKDKYMQLKKYAAAFDWNAAAELLKS